jgi:hypothetical protein
MYETVIKQIKESIKCPGGLDRMGILKKSILATRKEVPSKLFADMETVIM